MCDATSVRDACVGGTDATEKVWSENTSRRKNTDGIILNCFNHPHTRAHTSHADHLGDVDGLATVRTAWLWLPAYGSSRIFWSYSVGFDVEEETFM